MLKISFAIPRFIFILYMLKSNQIEKSLNCNSLGDFFQKQTKKNLKYFKGLTVCMYCICITYNVKAVKILYTALKSIKI